MSPEITPPKAVFALLASGASFSCEVLAALQQRDCPPAMLVLPEYPPANRVATELIASAPSRRLLQMAGDIEIAYVPAARQGEFAAVVKRSAFDFLLVACWPYLLEQRLLESPAKASLNLHPSLLPRYRGPDPLGLQMAAHDPRFGVTLHLLDQYFDHGDIVAQTELESVAAQADRTMLERECARLGAELFIEAIDTYPQWKPVAQTA